MYSNSYKKYLNGSNYAYTKLKADDCDAAVTPKRSCSSTMPQKLMKSAHYIELGGRYQYWPVLVPRGIRLYTYEQIPVFLRDNPYITDGYRAYLPSRLCIKSLFILSNETVNIWSHLLGFLLFFTLGIYDMASVLPATGASREDYVIYSIGLFCFQYWRQVYLVTVLAMILAVFFAQIHPHYLSKQWQRLRSILFCSVAGYGLIPTVHWVWLNGGFSSELVQSFIPRVLGMYVIAALAFIFYVSKVPERYFPGQLNYLGSSHQVWHVLVIVMFYWWHQAALFILTHRHSHPCPDYTVHT
ncbi:progestin and adipoQ receptor family member 3-like isoform X3 [Salvelinus fontinalis]|uniref:progestin and adipoQ receptor family member 3-like isoform X3 n=1 Tax=Salvelinus fontinalis TaxID=8038 RepID=UPI002486B51F|nr:progestin and adipoQ receptor family member 3-like isoform X3 [Salvelinus fontinalis]